MSHALLIERIVGRYCQAKDESDKPSIKPARYAKDMMLVQVLTSGGWKNRGQRLAEALGRWTHRERGYIMSKKKADRFKQLYDEGWDAEFMSNKLVPPKKKD